MATNFDQICPGIAGEQLGTKFNNVVTLVNELKSKFNAQREVISVYGSGASAVSSTVNTVIAEFVPQETKTLVRIDAYFQTAYADGVAGDSGYIVIYDADAGSDVVTLQLTSGSNSASGTVSGTLSAGTKYQVIIRVTSTDATTPATAPADGNILITVSQPQVSSADASSVS